MVDKEIDQLGIDVIIGTSDFYPFQQSVFDDLIQVFSGRLPSHTHVLLEVLNLGIGMEEKVVEQLMLVGFGKERT